MSPIGEDRVRPLEEAGVFPSIASSLQHWFDPEEIKRRAQQTLRTGYDSSYATLDMDDYAQDCRKDDNPFPILALNLSSTGSPLASSIQLRYRDTTGLVFCIGSHGGEYLIHLRPSRKRIRKLKEVVEEIECCFNNVHFKINELWEIRGGYRLPFGVYEEKTEEHGNVEYQTDPNTAEFFYTLGEISSIGRILPAYMACLAGEKSFKEFAERRGINSRWWRKNRDFYLEILKDLISPLAVFEDRQEESVDALRRIFGEKYIEDAGANALVNLHKTYEYLSKRRPPNLPTLYRILSGEYQLIDQLSGPGNSEEWEHVKISLQRGL